jgi:ribosomal protein S18 acetylase RimI-like enzyme
MTPIMLRVRTATADRRTIALELLYSSLPAEERAARVAESLQSAADGELDLSHLLLAELDDSPVGVLLLLLPPDGTGFVWPPVVTTQQSSNEIEDALLQAAAQRLDAEKAWIGQCLLDLNQSRERKALTRNGFAHLTDLKFFDRSLGPALADSEQAALDRGRGVAARHTLEYVPYRRAHNRLRFANVLAQTYRGTLDCPELNEVRDARQSLTHHEAAGSFSPDMWRLYRHDGDDVGDVGVLLMVERPEQQAWEVVYLGVIETARRRGLARAMLFDGLQAARDAGAERLLLAVDARNAPAIQLYESLGFRLKSVRAAHVRLRGDQALREKPTGY